MDVGFNHFFHAPSKAHGGDLVYIQGHSAFGIYARFYLEGRLGFQRRDASCDYIAARISELGRVSTAGNRQPAEYKTGVDQGS